MLTKKIAIDGPSGAGKSTIAKLLAQSMGYTYIDTGAMYRAVALYCITKGVEPENSDQVEALLEDIEIDIRYENGIQQIFLLGENVSEKIRTPQMSLGASNVSKHKKVREKLTAMQRELANKYNVIMDGRDIATTVLPDSDVAIFLTADVKARAKRRYDELTAKGENVTFEEVLSDMELRDKNDSTRENSPLKQAENAILVDTTNLTLENSVLAIQNIINKKLR
ncbi:MAG: (d)CMP kinase [Clostridia bacterium]|nr:(d)CMP kinase [Clostridia bacterium]